MEKQVNIPKLRFPKFEEFWEISNGRQLFESISNKNHNSDLPILAISQEYGAVPREMIDYKISVTDKSIESYKVVEKGNFIISLRSFQGGIEYSNYHGICSPAYVILKPKRQINDIFFKNYLKTDRYIIELNKKLEGIRDGKMISYSYFSEINLTFPSLSEQTKIASFLTTVDDKLQALKNKKQLLEQYKKGVMQKIFSQEIRFKDDIGNDFPEWEKKKLGEVANKKSSNISANKIEDNFGDYIIYGASGILKKVDFYKEEDDYISIIKDGAGVGRLLYCKGQSSVLGTMEIIRPNEGINTYYLYCLLSNIDFVKYVTGSTIPHIYFKDYSSEICGLPCLEEQTKIATFISAIYDKIKAVEVQIEKMEVWKKGLLQQMFC